MKTDSDLKKLAKDVYNGQVFISNIPEKVQTSFMVLMLMSPEQMPKDIGAVYEYYSEAGPRAINGLPTFFSANFLTSEEFKTFRTYLSELEEFMKQWDSKEE